MHTSFSVLVAAGAGAWGIDVLIEKRWGVGPFVHRVASWEPQLRSIMRVILGFLITLHGCRKLFGVMEPAAGRRSFTLDALPAFTGYLDLLGGVMMMVGLFVRPTALVLSFEALIAYVFIAQPRTLWPIRNGGIEALLYFVVFLYFAAAGAGVWSIDARAARRKLPSGAWQPSATS